MDPLSSAFVWPNILHSWVLILSCFVWISSSSSFIKEAHDFCVSWALWCWRSLCFALCLSDISPGVHWVPHPFLHNVIPIAPLLFGIWCHCSEVQNSFFYLIGYWSFLSVSEYVSFILFVNKCLDGNSCGSFEEKSNVLSDPIKWLSVYMSCHCETYRIITTAAIYWCLCSKPSSVLRVLGVWSQFSCKLLEQELLSLFYRWENWAAEIIYNLQRVAYLPNRAQVKRDNFASCFIHILVFIVVI